MLKPIVGEIMGVDPILLEKRTRKREICQARHVAIYCIRETFNARFSHKVIGEHFGNIDHSSSMHAVQTIGDICDVDKRFAAKVNECLVTYHETLENIKYIQNKLIDRMSESVLMLSCEGLPVRTGLLDTIS